MFLAGCADSPTGPDVEEWQIDALQDLDCGDYGDPCVIDPIDVCAASGDCDNGDGGWEDPGWPDDPWPDDDDPWQGDDDDDGGGGGGGGGGQDDVVCPYSAGDGCDWWLARPPLYGDDLGPGHEDPPDCDADDLHPVEQAWCDGDVPTDDQTKLLASSWDKIGPRCPDLTDEWVRSKGNIRIFTYDEDEHDFGGGAPAYGDWILLAKQWLETDAELALAHELLHLSGTHHRDESNLEAFIEAEKKCSGGRSSFES